MAYKRWTKSADQLKPDTRYNSLVLAKFVNSIMVEGKKSVAMRIVYDALDVVAKRIKDTPPNDVFEQAVGNCKPNVQVRSRRVGGSNYQVPMPVNRKRQQSLAFRWLRDAARGRKANRWRTPWRRKSWMPIAGGNSRHDARQRASHG